MSTKSKSIVNLKSSEKVANFLASNHLHKKDFAEMIGVTLSYVYNLIDNAIPFSTRGITLERIATVMDVEPEEFVEYKIPQEPVVIDESVEFLRDKQTGVMYIAERTGNAGGLTPLLDKDGKPMTTFKVSI